MRGFLTALALIGVALIGRGQISVDTSTTPVWVDMMQNPDVKFEETQKAFEQYWDGRKRTKGDGHNPYKRWEWFMQYELKDNGKIRSAEEIHTEVRKFQKTYGTYQSAVSHSSSRAGGTVGQWESLGPIAKPRASSGQPNGMGRVNAIGVHPTSKQIIFIGSPNGGIWRTYDGGQTWTSNTDTNFIMQVSSIVFDPQNPSIVYAGTGDRDAGARSPRGVMKSTDAGISWKVANSGMGNRVVGKMIIDPNHPDTLVAATSGGIYRSTNAGGSWSLVSNSTSHFKDIVENPINFNIQYATNGGGYYRSTNGGQSWTSITLPLNGNRAAVAVTADDPAYVYVVQTTRTSFAGLMLSKDTGRTFTVQSTSPNVMDWSTNGSGSGGQAWYDLDITADPKNKAHVYIGGVNIFKSSNEGRNWAINAHWTGSGGAPAVHADHHVFEWSADGTTFYDGSDGGIAQTTNGGPNWTDLSSGVAISEVYKIGQHPFNEDRVICGYQDNGSAIYRGKGDWTTEIGGDGMECVFDHQNNSYVYGSLYYGAVRRSSNGGSSFSSITNGISEQGAWVSPYILDEGNANIMYIGMNSDIWRNSQVRTSRSWTNITSGITSAGGSWSVLESSPADPNILYGMRTGKRLWRTDNARASSPTWVNLTSNLPAGSAASDIEAHPWDSNTVYITSGSRVWVSTDRGGTWTDISGNLPGTAKRSIAYDKFSAGGIYVGGTPYVYYKDSSMSNWVEYSNGLPGDVSVTELEIFYDVQDPLNSKLRAGTYGRGLWSIELFELSNREPLGKLRGDSGYFCMANTIKLFGDSSINSDDFLWEITPDTGFTFINGSNAKSKNIELSFNAEGFYTVSLTASNYYGKSEVTWHHGLIIGSTQGSYCSTSTTASSASGFGLTRVQLNEINHSTSSYNGSTSNTSFECSDFTKLRADSTYQLSVNTAGSEFVQAYIDFNKDGDFTDASENIGSLSMGSGTRSISFQVPSSAQRNTMLTMRLISDSSPISSSCGQLTNGESEDYGVWIDEPLIAIDVNDTLICPNEEVFIAGYTTGRIDSITWDFGALAAPQFATGYGPHRVSYAGTGSWKIKAQLNGDMWFEDSISVIPSLVANLLLDSAKSSLCEQGFARILVQNQSGLSGVYQWYVNGVEDTTLIDSVYFQTGLNSFRTYDYQVITNNGICFDTSDVLTVIPHDRPNAWIRLFNSTQCLDGNAFKFEDISIFTGGSLTHKWYFGDGDSSTLKNPIHTYTSTGSYTGTLIATSNEGCSDTTTHAATVIASPDSTFAFANTSGLEYSFTPTDMNLVRYVWDFGNGDTSHQVNPTYTFLKNGTFSVKLEVENTDGCVTESTLEVIVEGQTSVEEFSSKYGVSVYPNPAKGQSNLSVRSNNDVRAKLFDVSGKLIEEIHIRENETVRSLQLPSAGSYILKVTIEGNSASYTIENQ